MEATPKHTQTVEGWAALEANGKITPFVFKRRENGEDDVSIKILYTGMCDTDLNYIRNHWACTIYPLVPGHESTGVITKVGSNVSNFKIGDRVGVGCLAASCLNCECCKDSHENYCSEMQFTFRGIFWDGSINYGGYSKMLVANKRYVVHIPDNVPLDSAAPILCAGMAVFGPMKEHNMLQAGKLGIVGLGGLGHVAVKFGKAFKLHVTVISTSPSKEKEAKVNLGADEFIISTNPKQMQVMLVQEIITPNELSNYCYYKAYFDKENVNTLDYIIDTVSAKHSLVSIIDLLKVNGKLVLVGVPAEPIEIPALSLIMGKKSVSGTMAAGMNETQEMMDVCGKHNITCDIELVKPDYINEALDRIAKNDVHYRFVIDIAGESNL